MLWVPDAKYGKRLGRILPDVLLGNVHFDKLFAFTKADAERLPETREFFQEFHYGRLDSGKTKFIVALDPCFMVLTIDLLKSLVRQTNLVALELRIPPIHNEVIQHIYRLHQNLPHHTVYIKCADVYENARCASVADVKRKDTSYVDLARESKPVVKPVVAPVVKPVVAPVDPEIARSLELQARAKAALEKQRLDEYNAKQMEINRLYREDQTRKQAIRAKLEKEAEEERVRLRDLNWARSKEQDMVLAALAEAAAANDYSVKAVEEEVEPEIVVSLIPSSWLELFEDSPAPVHRTEIRYKTSKPVVQKEQPSKSKARKTIELPESNKPGEGYGSTGETAYHCICGIPTFGLESTDDYTDFREEHVELGLQDMYLVGFPVRCFLNREDKVSTIDGFVKLF